MASAGIRNADPTDEMGQTFFKGFKTLLSVLRKDFEESHGGEIQSSDNEIKQPFMNLLSNVFSGTRKKSDDSEVQSIDFGDELGRTLINIIKIMSSSWRRNFNPKNEVAKYL